MLHSLHAEFTPLLAAALREVADTMSVALHALEETTPAVHDAQPGAPEFTIDFSALQPHAGRLECADGLALHLLDHLLRCGGTLAREQRAPSEIEARLLHTALMPMLQAYAELWRRYVTFQPQLEACREPLSSDEVLYVASYRITTPTGTGRLAFVLRLPAWQDALRAHSHTPSEERPMDMQSNGLLDAIGGCMVTARAVLGNTRMTVADLMSLRPGDIICLDQEPDAPVEIRINNRPKLSGQARVQSGHYVVTVDSHVKESK